MKKIAPLLLLALWLTSCKSTRLGETDNLQVRFLDDHIIAEDLMIEGTLVGGLSGVDYHEGTYYLVSDHPSQPRIYKAQIELQDKRIHDIDITDVILLDTSAPELEGMHLDLEGITYNPVHRFFYLSSEGYIEDGKDPGIFIIEEDGSFRKAFELPESFLAGSEKEPRSNGSLEGLAPSFNQEGLWAAMELPLVTDGPTPKLIRTKSPVRITYFNKKTNQAERQFTYMLEPIAKIPWLYFAVNGVTDLVEYAPDKFLVLERGFASGHGSNGNTVRIFDVDASMATNTLEKHDLKYNFHNPAKKELVYDFKWAKDYLAVGVIDNIEGISFGPVLPNGNPSLIIVADNNFNSMGRQYNQFILMELQLKNEAAEVSEP